MAAAVNGVDCTGVRQKAIDEVKKWRDWLLENEDGDRQQYEHGVEIQQQQQQHRYFWCFPFDCTRRDAEYMVQCLRMFLPLEEGTQKTTVVNRLTSFVSFCSNQRPI
jgi:hypothetical protein